MGLVVYLHMVVKMVLDGSTVERNIDNGGRGDKGQEEQVEGMMFKVGRKY